MKPGLFTQIQRLFIMSWAKTLVYRADIAAYTVVSIAAPIVALAVWYTVAQSGGLGGNPQTVLTYYILVILVELITRAWRGIYLVERIRTGKIIEYLLRPPIILLDNITSNITTKIVQLTLPIIGFLFVATTFPQFFTPAIYESRNIFLFIVSALFASITWFLFDISIGLTAFWLEEAFELHSYRFLLMQVASGILIPFSAMPDLMKEILSFLPFRYVISAPVEILLNQPVDATTMQLLMIQIGWTIFFIFLVRILYVRGLRRYEIPG